MWPSKKRETAAGPVRPFFVPTAYGIIAQQKRKGQEQIERLFQRGVEQQQEEQDLKAPEKSMPTDPPLESLDPKKKMPQDKEKMPPDRPAKRQRTSQSLPDIIHL